MPWYTRKNDNLIEVAKGVPIKAWTKGVALEEQARVQLPNVACRTFLVTRKAAVRGREGELGIIVPGAWGARSYLVRSKGDPESSMMAAQKDLVGIAPSFDQIVCVKG